MALYLEQGEELLGPEQLHDPFEQALREDHLIPVCFCSAETGAGIAELLAVLARLAPNPTEGNPPPFLKGEGEAAERVVVSPDPAKHVIAHVFKVTIDPFVGKMGIFRVHQGTVRPGAQLLVGDARKPIKLAHLYQLQGKEHVEITQAVPGDICAVPKIDEIHFDAVLHDSHDEDHHHLKSVTFPPAMLGLAIRTEKRGDEQKLSEGLHRLMAEDPCVRVEHHVAQNETVLYGLGDLHLRVMLQRLTERYGVAVKTSPPARALSRDDHAPGRRPLPAQEADRRRRPVRRGVPAHRAARARRGLRVRRRRRRRRHSRPVHPGRRERRAPGADRRRDRRLPAAGHPRLGLRRQAPRGRLEGSRVRLGRPQGVHRGDPAGQPDRARADRAHRDQLSDLVDRRHQQRPGDAARPHQRAGHAAGRPRRRSRRWCRWASCRTTCRGSRR